MTSIPDSAAEIFEKLGIDPDDLPKDAPKVPPEHVALLLRNIGGILHQSESFRALAPDQQQQIMANTERIADALAQPPEEAAPALQSFHDDPYAIDL